LADQVIDTGTVRFTIRPDGIVYGVALPERQQTVEDARVNLAACRDLAGHGDAPLLIDVRNTGTLSREARKIYTGEEGARTISALGFVADSAFGRVAGNLFIRLARTRFPVRLFATEEEALRWLRSFLP
jgi:hypothetical protein